MNNFYKVLNNLFKYFTVAALVSMNLFAGTTGKIAGKVIDAKTKEPMIGVNVLIVGTTMGAATDVSGNYFILNIPPGVYELKASTVGYGSV
ncbi:MAG: carboxypeptidase-like regulatory domain-containing protein, partial [Desulfomonilaceae bacterium]